MESPIISNHSEFGKFECSYPGELEQLKEKEKELGKNAEPMMLGYNHLKELAKNENYKITTTLLSEYFCDLYIRVICTIYFDILENDDENDIETKETLIGSNKLVGAQEKTLKEAEDAVKKITHNIYAELTKKDLDYFKSNGLNETPPKKLLEKSKGLVMDENYKEEIRLTEEYSLPAILCFMSFYTEEEFLKTIKDNELKKLIDPDLKNETLFEDEVKRTLLHRVAYKNKTKLIDKFLTLLQEENKEQKLLEMQDRNGRTAMYCAASVGQKEALYKLMEWDYYDEIIKVPNCKGRTILHAAAYGNYLDIIKYFVYNESKEFVEQRDDFGRNLLYSASCKGDTKVLEFFIKKNEYHSLLSNLDKHKKKKKNLFELSLKVHYEAKYYDLSNVIRILIDNYELINQDETPLHTLSKYDDYNDYDMFDDVLRYSKKHNYINRKETTFGNTPLHNAVFYGKSLDYIDLLIEHKADVSTKNTDERIPLSLLFLTNCKNNNKPSTALKLLNYNYDFYINKVKVKKEKKDKLGFSTVQKQKIEQFGKKSYENLNLKNYDTVLLGFFNKIVSFLKKQNTIEPLKSTNTEHIPIINQAVRASNDQLVKAIINDTNLSSLLHLSNKHLIDLNKLIVKSKCEPELIKKLKQKIIEIRLDELTNKIKKHLSSRLKHQIKKESPEEYKKLLIKLKETELAEDKFYEEKERLNKEVKKKLDKLLRDWRKDLTKQNLTKKSTLSESKYKNLIIKKILDHLDCKDISINIHYIEVMNMLMEKSFFNQFETIFDTYSEVLPITRIGFRYDNLLHFAQTKQHVDFLTKQGFSIDTQNKLGETLFHKLCLKENDNVVTKIISEYWNTKNDKIKSIIEYKDCIGNSLLHTAVFNKKENLVKALLTHKADSNSKGVHDITPLHVAAKNGSTDILKALIVHNGDITITDQNQSNLLHSACHGIVEKNDCWEVIRYLLEEANEKIDYAFEKDKFSQEPIDILENYYQPYAEKYEDFLIEFEYVE
ncbi:MAG: hypothetical protein DGJ47_000835 [Rickettsiaceae bacterium]